MKGVTSWRWDQGWITLQKEDTYQLYKYSYIQRIVLQHSWLGWLGRWNRCILVFLYQYAEGVTMDIHYITYKTAHNVLVFHGSDFPVMNAIIDAIRWVSLVS